MAFENCTAYPVDLCETCTGMVEYGTAGDWSYMPPEGSAGYNRRVSEDMAHAALMFNSLGVPLGHVFNEDGEGSFGNCEGCGTSGTTVYPAIMFTEES